MDKRLGSLSGFGRPTRYGRLERDGKKTPGVFRNGMWVLDETGNGFDSGDRSLNFGLLVTKR